MRTIEPQEITEHMVEHKLKSANLERITVEDKFEKNTLVSKGKVVFEIDTEKLTFNYSAGGSENFDRKQPGRLQVDFSEMDDLLKSKNWYLAKASLEGWCLLLHISGTLIWEDMLRIIFH